MKKMWSRVLGHMLLFACLLFLLPGISGKASNDMAGQDGVYHIKATDKTVYWSYYPSVREWNKRVPILLDEYRANRKKQISAGWKETEVKVVSSNSAVVSALNYKKKKLSDGSALFGLDLKKAGTVRITLTATYQKGKQQKKYTKSFVLKSVKYENPFIAITINSKKQTSKYNRFCMSVTESTLKGKDYAVLRYILKKNWVVKKVNYYDNYPYYSPIKRSAKTIKSGAKLKAPEVTQIQLQNRLTHICENVDLYIYDD